MLILLVDLCSVGVTCVCYVECDDVDGCFCISNLMSVFLPPSSSVFCLLLLPSASDPRWTIDRGEFSGGV